VICHDLHPFFDGELATEEQVAFRDHLADCKRCQQQLAGRIHEEVAVDAPVARRSDRTAPRRAHGRALWIGAAVGVAALLALVVWWRRGAGEPSSPEQTAIVLAPKRHVDVRFAAAAFDRHRERDVVRAGPGSAASPYEEVSLAVLGELDRAGDRDGLIAASALSGDLARARRAAESQPDSCAKLTALSALALLEAQPSAERALALAVDARTRFPACTPAMWNEAIALEHLQQPLPAAIAFDRVAAQREPGWSIEAAERAGRLRAR
jgi:cellulose synthase operon protein C